VIYFNHYVESSIEVNRAVRAHPDDPFASPAIVAELPGADTASPSADELRLYHGRKLDGGGHAIELASRRVTSDPFLEGRILAELAPTGDALVGPYYATGLNELFFTRMADGGSDLWHARNVGDDTFDQVAPLTELNLPPLNVAPVVTSDGLELYFYSSRLDSNTIWRALRKTVDTDFGAPESVDELKTSALYDGPAAADWISVDGCRLYLEAQVKDTAIVDLFVAERQP
jgi:hypothetical protein